MEVYAWLWVDAPHLNAQFRGDSEEASHEIRMDCRPYQGPDIYPIDSVLFMLDRGICDAEDVKWGLRPTRRVPVETFRNAARDVEEVLEAR